MNGGTDQKSVALAKNAKTPAQKEKKKYKKSKAKQSKAEQNRAERATRNSSPNDGYGSDNESSAEMCEVAVKPEES